LPGGYLTAGIDGAGGGGGGGGCIVWEEVWVLLGCAVGECLCGFGRLDVCRIGRAGLVIAGVGGAGAAALPLGAAGGGLLTVDAVPDVQPAAASAHSASPAAALPSARARGRNCRARGVSTRGVDPASRIRTPLHTAAAAQRRTAAARGRRLP
jgi:hypothetical protein